MPVPSRGVETIVLSLLLVLGGAAMILVAWLGSQRRLPLNAVVGIRTRTTMSSERAWYAAHRAAAGPLGFGGGVFVCGGIGLAVSGFDNIFGLLSLWLSLGAGLIFILGAARVGQKAANRLR